MARVERMGRANGLAYQKGSGESCGGLRAEPEMNLRRMVDQSITAEIGENGRRGRGDRRAFSGSKKGRFPALQVAFTMRLEMLSLKLDR